MYGYLCWAEILRRPSTVVRPRPSSGRTTAEQLPARPWHSVYFALSGFAFLGHFLCALISLLHYFGERVAATEPDLRGGTADRKRKK